MIILMLVITSLVYVKLQIRNWMFYSEYQLIWTQINIACWLTSSWHLPLSYREQSIDLLWKSMDWFLYDNGPRHERVNSVVKSHFSYCPLIWMFYTRRRIKNVNKIRERYLRLMTNLTKRYLHTIGA